MNAEGNSKKYTFNYLVPAGFLSLCMHRLL